MNNRMVVEPSIDYILWCPFCDSWHQRDAFVARKRLGQHIVNEHPEEVRFKKGIKPPEIQEYNAQTH